MLLNNWRPWAAAGLLAWSGVLLWDMSRLKSDPRFQQRFPGVAAADGPTPEEEAERQRHVLSVRLGRSGQPQE